MSSAPHPVHIVIAEDDDEDFLLTEQALASSQVANSITRVVDGRELLDYLLGAGKFQGQTRPQPLLILLDLNMPRMDGRMALKLIKSSVSLCHLPIVVLTTSHAEEDIIRSYQVGVNSFVTKPVTFRGLADAMAILGRYWLEIVNLPVGA